MADNSVTVTIKANTVLARAFLSAFVKPVYLTTHSERFLDWALLDIAPRLVLMKVGERGRWRFLGRPTDGR